MRRPDLALRVATPMPVMSTIRKANHRTKYTVRSAASTGYRAEVTCHRTMKHKHIEACVKKLWRTKTQKTGRKEMKRCPECNGTGEIEIQIGGDGYDNRCCAVADVPVECPECNGTGKVKGRKT